MSENGAGDGRALDAGVAAERLAAFEAFAQDVRRDLAQVGDRMAGLRDAGKTKSATYQQLFAMRATLREMDRRLRDYGL